MLSVSTSEARTKLVQLEQDAKKLREYRIDSKIKYLELEKEYRKWRKLCLSVFTNIFSNSAEIQNEVFPSTDPKHYSDDWRSEATFLLNQLRDQQSEIESLIQRLPYIYSLNESKSIGNQMIEIFISHSSKDEKIAEALVTCIEKSLQVPERSIRCTSVRGYELMPGGRITSEVLLQNIESSKIVVCLLTPSSQQSGYVLVELGAAWGLKKPLCILTAGGARYSDAPGPLSEFDILNAEDFSHIARLVEAIALYTRYDYRSQIKITGACTNFAAFVKSFPD